MLRWIMLIAALVVMTALPGCWRSISWRHKLTLLIKTPAAEVTGSSVVSIDARFFGQPIGNDIEYDVTGEAVVVEALPGKDMFALLGETGEPYLSAARGTFLGMDRSEWLFEIPKPRKPVSLFPDHMPMLVTFENVTKPETLKLVAPWVLAARFGPGVGVKAVTLEIPRAAVTEGRVDEVSGWLEAVGRALDADTRTATSKRRPDDPEIQLLGSSSFSTELFK